jgi:hypothetical protein
MEKMTTYWDGIKSKYPETFKQLCKDHATIEQWGEIDYPTTWGIFINESKWILRHLFDFFDSRNVNAYCYSSNGEEWYYAILTKGKNLTPSKNKYNNRESAELACYEKAFELLEMQIK